MSLSLTSPAFSHNEAIPDKYTCRGSDISPPRYNGKMYQNRQKA